MGEVSCWFTFLLPRLDGRRDFELPDFEDGSSVYFDDEPLFDISVSTTVLFLRDDLLGCGGVSPRLCCTFCLFDLLGGVVGFDSGWSSTGLDSGRAGAFRFLVERVEDCAGCDCGSGSTARFAVERVTLDDM